MTTTTARQRYLYLVSRLYELAAEFTNSELDEMKALAWSGDVRPVVDALDVLKRLHGDAPANVPVQTVQPAQAKSLKKTPTAAEGDETSQGRRRAWNARALESLLQDKVLFPSVGEIAAVLPSDVAARPKEARDRYVQRVMKYVTSLPDAERVSFRDRLTSGLSRKPSGFVSQWKSLIKDL